MSLPHIICLVHQIFSNTLSKCDGNPSLSHSFSSQFRTSCQLVYKSIWIGMVITLLVGGKYSDCTVVIAIMQWHKCIMDVLCAVALLATIHTTVHFPQDFKLKIYYFSLQSTHWMKQNLASGEHIISVVTCTKAYKDTEYHIWQEHAFADPGDNSASSTWSTLWAVHIFWVCPYLPQPLHLCLAWHTLTQNLHSG